MSDTGCYRTPPRERDEYDTGGLVRPLPAPPLPPAEEPLPPGRDFGRAAAYIRARFSAPESRPLLAREDAERIAAAVRRLRAAYGDAMAGAAREFSARYGGPMQDGHGHGTPTQKNARSKE